jgi:hypothetical protein
MQTLPRAQKGASLVIWQTLIEEHNKWVAHNFPEETELESILGVIEELGELAHHHLKERQGIRGDVAIHQAGAQDAIGDLTIFLLGVMNVTGPPCFAPHLITKNATQAIHRMAFGVGRLGNQLVVSSDYLQRDTVEFIIACMEQYCGHRSWVYEQIVMDTWEQVKDRDWQANPEDGVVVDATDATEIPTRDRIAQAVHQTCPTLPMHVCLQMADDGLETARKA